MPPTAEVRPSTATVDLAVLGLGTVGLSLASAASRAGLRVVGYDPSPEAVRRINDRRTSTAPAKAPGNAVDLTAAELAALHHNGFCATTDIGVTAQAGAYAICVPTTYHQDGTPDYTVLDQAAASVAAHLRPGCLVVVESTVSPGTTDTLVRGTLERLSGLAAGEDFSLAHSPERIDPGNRTHRFTTIPKIVGGYTPACAAAAQALYRRLCPHVVVARSTREAEFAKLMENAYRAANIALVNDLAVLAPRIGVDLADAIACAATKPFGFQPFQPGPGVGGACIPTAVAYLRHAARGAGHALQVLDAAQAVNDRAASDVVQRAAQLCAARGLNLADARVLLLGVTYKPDVADTRCSPAEPIVRLLRTSGAVVSFHDPYVLDWVVDGLRVEPARACVLDAVREADLTILLQSHQAYLQTHDDGTTLARAARLLLDTRQILPVRGAVDQVWVPPPPRPPNNGSSPRDRLGGFADQVARARGEVLSVEVAGPDTPALVERLHHALGKDVDVRLVLGSACPTTARTVDQFVAALQLPYGATRGWADFLGYLRDRPASLRQCIVVTDASGLLEQEDQDRWRELVAGLRRGPYRSGGGWATLVLTDHETGWASRWVTGQQARAGLR